MQPRLPRARAGAEQANAGKAAALNYALERLSEEIYVASTRTP